ncbi:MAG: hypothetical protein AUJ01_00495 [Acidobacteria bacterium 13_1_40CM_3_65_5]|nr:MAG: hypothetical protein AUJ01_00495 [Acidobacteria bacterium 13_1_40CM_3_65_5]
MGRSDHSSSHIIGMITSRPWKETAVRRHGPAIAVFVMLISSSANNAAEPGGPVFPNEQEPSSASADEVIVTGLVEDVYAPRLFTIAPAAAAERKLLVFAPNARLTPRPGSWLAARGVFRQPDDTGFETVRGYGQFNELARDEFASRPVLIARSFVTSTGHPLAKPAVISPLAATGSRQEESPETRWSQFAIAVRPAALADLIDSLAGHAVRLQSARVVGVLNPRVFLVDSQTRLPPLLDRNRVLVFIDAGTLRVDPAVLVASTVTVSGTARTLLGMQVSREVAWPPALTRDVVERLEIRAAVLARSVRTNEGVDLLVR